MDKHQRKQHSEGGDWEWFTEFAGIHMPSNYYVFHLISKIFSAQPHLTQIVEFGTYYGNMSVCLGLQGVRHAIPCTTYDIHPYPDEKTKRIFSALNIEQRVADIFDPAIQQEIVARLSTGPTYLLIDNGDKKREFELYVPHLVPGSVVSVHDYGTEFVDKDWQVHASLVEPYLQGEWDKHNVQFASFTIRPREGRD